MSSEPTIQSLFDLTGRVALVTGGAGFLGQSMAAALAEAGASVVVSSRDLQRAQSVADRLPAPSNARHHAVSLDHNREQSIAEGFERAVQQAGQVDILINNGQGGPGESWSDASAAGLEEHFKNAAGYFLLARRLRDHVVRRGAAGAIVMMGSMYGVVGSYPDAYLDICSASPVAYHALKGGIIHMTRHLAVYWAPDKVRVNCLSPGPFPNPATVPAGLVPRLESKSPMGRMGQPHELKGAVVFLASDASSYVTGQNLLIDGGWTAW